VRQEGLRQGRIAFGEEFEVSIEQDYYNAMQIFEGRIE